MPGGRGEAVDRPRRGSVVVGRWCVVVAAVAATVRSSTFPPYLMGGILEEGPVSLVRAVGRHGTHASECVARRRVGSWGCISIAGWPPLLAGDVGFSLSLLVGQWESFYLSSVDSWPWNQVRVSLRRLDHFDRLYPAHFQPLTNQSVFRFPYLPTFSSPLCSAGPPRAELLELAQSLLVRHSGIVENHANRVVPGV
jgi:hypothetical protein